MTALPLVTVIISARNEQRRVGECLESLDRQTYAPLETIVVDDGSTDRTAAIAAGFAACRCCGVRIPVTELPCGRERRR